MREKPPARSTPFICVHVQQKIRKKLFGLYKICNISLNFLPILTVNTSMESYEIKKFENVCNVFVSLKISEKPNAKDQEKTRAAKFSLTL